MKTKNFVFALTVTYLILGFTACKKTGSSAIEEIETTVELSTQLAVADNLTEDANALFMEVATENGLTGEIPPPPFQSTGILGCGTVTITPAAGFPKTIVINFGAGCNSGNGIYRKGKINITLTDSVRKQGSKAMLNFDGYYVNGFKKEGIITWTNNSTPAIKGWERTVENGKITNPAGKYWLHSGTKTVIQTAGYATPRNLLDDIFSITGNSSVTNSNGINCSAAIVEALQKKTICENITAGSISLKGPHHTAMVNFGTGDCDNIATIAIDGGTPRTILLR